MINPMRGEVGLTIDGTERVLRLTLGALAALEARLGARSLADLVQTFEGGDMRSDDLILLLWAGLNGGGFAVSVEDVGNARVQGGPVAAAQAAGLLLRQTFMEIDT